jgi:dTDP-4-dehydrorhamnose 3,5-epimerase
MVVHSTSLPGVLLFEPRLFEDHRGWFAETFCSEHGPTAALPPFVQDNHSCSHKNVLRGLHYQIRHPQAKLVRVVRGEVFDVAVDLRRGSPHFGKWFGTRLSARNRLQMFVPAGFAHGLLALEEPSEVVYKCSDAYHPEHDRTVLWNDPQIGIAWPLEGEPLLSAKDLAGTPLNSAECYD